MSNQSQLIWTGRCHCWVGDSLERGKKKKKKSASISWHGLSYEEIGHRKLNRANCLSAGKQAWMGEVICQSYIATKQYQVMKLDFQIPKATGMLPCHCINSLSPLPNNLSSCLPHPIIWPTSISTCGSIFLKPFIMC